MKKTHRPKECRCSPTSKMHGLRKCECRASTTFCFSKEEVAEALLSLMKSKGEESPMFLSIDNCGIWDNQSNTTTSHVGEWELCFCIDHPNENEI
ncbi:hypothetical protein LCGC14_0142760 [marine sediment metagenome]|uniref:Uncharacterized protein n=1 Tax=marine sediment metagenome TaxID=412755 RepID=A0A0F9XIK4_9ZZZZ